MKNKSQRRALFAVIGGVSAGLVYQAYRRQKITALSDLQANSHLLETACGPIEVAIQGDGQAVLISHGGGGGYDQGLLLCLPQAGFRFIIPSRPGYLRTPLETGHTFEAQADAFAALLDVLYIEQVAVIGTSAGGPAAIQFALRYPERCWGIILISAISQSTTGFPQMIESVTEKVMPHSDFIPWLLMNTPLMEHLIDRNTHSQIGADPEKKALLNKLMKSVFPVSLRLDGTLNDLRQIAAMPQYPLEDISVPALVIHGDSDSIVPFSQGLYSSNAIPAAQLLMVKNGDHFSFITHAEITKPAIIEFLKSHAP